MPTTNLGLNIINSSDYVSPTPINNNFEIIDDLGVDYIISQGTTGIWRYRRWHSGTYECWAENRIADPVLDSAFGTNISHNTVTFPVTFSARPIVEVSVSQSGNGQSYVSYVSPTYTDVEIFVSGVLQNVVLAERIFVIGQVN